MKWRCVYDPFEIYLSMDTWKKETPHESAKTFWPYLKDMEGASITSPYCNFFHSSRGDGNAATVKHWSLKSKRSRTLRSTDEVGQRRKRLKYKNWPHQPQPSAEVILHFRLPSPFYRVQPAWILWLLTPGTIKTFSLSQNIFFPFWGGDCLLWTVKMVKVVRIPVAQQQFVKHSDLQPVEHQRLLSTG